MKWTVKLVAEGRGQALEREIATIEREDQVSPASIGLTIAEGKSIMEGPAARTGDSSGGTAWSRHPVLYAMRKSFRTKGYYQSTLRSVYGKIRMRVPERVNKNETSGVKV